MSANPVEPMTRKTLVLFTDRYPAVPESEAFLVNELPYIPKAIDRIIFVPVFAPAEMREIVFSASATQCCEALPVPVRSPARTWDKIRAFFSLNVYRDFFRAYKAASAEAAPAVNASRIFSFFKKNYNLVSYYERALKKRILPGEELYFYAYWFHQGAYIAHHLARRFGAPLFVRAHRYDIFPDGKNTFTLPHVPLLTDGVNVYVASAFGAAYLKRLYPRWADQIHVALLGSPDHGVAPYEASDVFHVVSCSFFNRVKKLERLVDALAKIKTFRIHWTHLGGDLSCDYARELQARARASFGENVTFSFEGMMKNEAIFQWYQAHSADVFVNVSDSEALPVTIREAISLGIPAIATDVEGNPEIVKPGVNGFLVPLENTASVLAETLEHLHAMPLPERNALRRAVRADWEAHHAAACVYPVFFKQVFQTEYYIFDQR